MSSRCSRLVAALLAAAAVALAAPAATATGSTYEGVVLTTTLSPAFVPPGAPVTLTVHAPALGQQAAIFQEKTATGWHVLARVVTSSAGDAAVTFTRQRAGAYDYRVMFDPLNSASTYAITGDTHRLVVTVVSFGDPRAYAFLVPSRAGPGRWNPCAPVTYRVNLAQAPKYAAADLAEALRRISQASGLTFRRLGTTSRIPGARGFAYDADLDVAWAKPGDTAYLSGRGNETGGIGGAVGHTRGGVTKFEHGYVVVNADAVAQLPGGFGAGQVHGLVLLHELGHAMGLNHVTADDQMMRPSADPKSRAALYGAGDLAGLRRLGSAGGCL